MKDLVTSNTNIQYESPTSSGGNVMAQVKVFQKKVKVQGKNYGTT